MYTSVSLRYLKIIHDFAVPLHACGVLRGLGSKADSRLIACTIRVQLTYIISTKYYVKTEDHRQVYINTLNIDTLYIDT